VEYSVRPRHLCPALGTAYIRVLQLDKMPAANSENRHAFLKNEAPDYFSLQSEVRRRIGFQDSRHWARGAQ
jgi:hypothetical protein